MQQSAKFILKQFYYKITSEFRENLYNKCKFRDAISNVFVPLELFDKALSTFHVTLIKIINLDKK